MNQPIRFRVSFKSKKRACKNGEMFNFHIIDDDMEMQVTAFPAETTSFFDLIQVRYFISMLRKKNTYKFQFNHTYELTNYNVKKEECNFPLFVESGKYICLLRTSKIDVIDNDMIRELQFNLVPNIWNLIRNAVNFEMIRNDFICHM